MVRVLSRPTGRDSNDGAVAQLGERYNGIVEVRGSIPLSSTTPLTTLIPAAPK